jgi:hypothetical protein
MKTQELLNFLKVFKGMKEIEQNRIIAGYERAIQEERESILKQMMN